MGPEDEASNTGGRAPLQLVCEATNEAIVYQRGERPKPSWAGPPHLMSRRRVIDEGIDADRVACVVILLEHGASPNTAGSYITPLMGAALKGNLAIVNMLLAAGSDANTPWRAGSQPCSPLFMVVLTAVVGKGPPLQTLFLRRAQMRTPQGFLEKH